MTNLGKLPDPNGYSVNSPQGQRKLGTDMFGNLYTYTPQTDDQFRAGLPPKRVWRGRIPVTEASVDGIADGIAEGPFDKVLRWYADVAGWLLGAGLVLIALAIVLGPVALLMWLRS